MFVESFAINDASTKLILAFTPEELLSKSDKEAQKSLFARIHRLLKWLEQSATELPPESQKLLKEKITGLRQFQEKLNTPGSVSFIYKIQDTMIFNAIFTSLKEGEKTSQETKDNADLQKKILLETRKRASTSPATLNNLNHFMELMAL